MTPSPEERALLRLAHTSFHVLDRACSICYPAPDNGPCVVIRTIDALEASEQQVAELRKRLSPTQLEGDILAVIAKHGGQIVVAGSEMDAMLHEIVEVAALREETT